MSFDWKAALGKIAPLAGTMLGGPWGGLAGKAIGEVFGHEGETPPDEAQMAAYIEKATPDQLIALKQIDADLKIKNKELNIKDDELTYKDKADARATHKDSQMPGILAILLTVGLFGSLIALMFIEVPEANKAIVFMMLGSIATAWAASMSYYHGTSKSSQEKTKLMSLR
jgi:hypothetical protein